MTDIESLKEELTLMCDGERKVLKHECPNCDGLGEISKPEGAPCPKCKGRGWIVENDRHIVCPDCTGDQITGYKKCDKCNGTGEIPAVVQCVVEKTECHNCGGTGTITRHHYEEIPADEFIKNHYSVREDMFDGLKDSEHKLKCPFCSYGIVKKHLQLREVIKGELVESEWLAGVEIIE